ncbi:MAG: hypothetical protein ACREPJ_15375 [Rhodanobacteraceae bacterium]
MSTKTKRLAVIVANRKHVRFADACAAAKQLGFMYRGGAGSHRAFARKDEPVGLNFQNRAGFIAPYQARQLIAMIEKCGGLS